MAKNRNGSKWIRPARRQAIYHRDGFCCVYCGRSAESSGGLTLDHVLARELGGTNGSRNLVTACLSCNSEKRALPTRVWFSTLRKRGVNTSLIAARVRRQTARPLDMTAGRRLAEQR